MGESIDGAWPQLEPRTLCVSSVILTPAFTNSGPSRHENHLSSPEVKQRGSPGRA